MMRLSFLAILLIPFFLFGQRSPSFSVVGGQISISNPSYDVIQDHFGLMWAGTSGGLLKYDGYAITQYKHNFQDSTSLPANTIQKLFVDGKGRLWVSVQNYGLCYFKRDQNQFYRIPGKPGVSGSLHSTTIYTIAEDDQGNLWVGGNAGLEKLIFSNMEYDSISFQQFKTNPDGQSSIDGIVYHLMFDSRHNLWVSTQSGIYRKDASSDIFIDMKDDDAFPEGDFRFAVEDHEGKIWIGSRGNHLYSYDYGEHELTPVADLILGDSELYATLDPEGNLLISQTGRGFLIFNTNTGMSTFYDAQKENALNIYGSFIRSPYIDNQGNLWLSGGAAFQISPAHNKEIRHLSLEFEGRNNVSAVHDDGRYIWIGQLFGGLIKYEKSTGKFQRFTECPSQNCLINNRVYHLSTLKDGRLLISGRGGLMVMNKESHSLSRIYEYSNLFRWAHEDRNGNIWLGVEGAGLSYLESGTGKRVFLLDGAQGPRISLVRQIIENEDGSFWLASSGDGLIYFHPETNGFEQYLPQVGNLNSLVGNRVECIMKDSKNRLWVGTREGLSCMDLNNFTFRNFTTNQGLSDDVISSIEEGFDGNIWVSTNNGINKIDGNSFNIDSYDMKDGFLNESFYYRASDRNTELLYFGGINGLDYFDPGRVNVNTIPPKVILTGFNVLGKDKPMEKTLEDIALIELDNEENFFTFTLSALHYVAPTKNKYAYHLEGFTDSWVEMGTTRTVTFTNLDPGKYTFKAKASNSDGIWSDEILSVDLIIHPPFWKTWWFRIISVLLITALLYAIYQYRITEIKKRESLKAAFEKQLAELEMKALRSQMNPHFLFNSLNSVKSLISHNQNRKASEYLTQFSKLIRKVLNNSRSKTVRLIDDIEALELYIRLEKMRFSDRFNYTINIAKGVNPDFIEVPPLLLQPFVENAVWHGIMHKEGGSGLIAINIYREGNYVIMEVDDNGIGRKMAANLQTKSRSKKESLGIELTAERLSYLSDLFGGESRFDIIDKYGDDGSSEGTKVKISLYLPE